MGDRNKTFTQNYEINSLAMAHASAKVKDFSVSQWLKEGDLIYLDNNDKTKEKSLEVIHTPGHTPDSIALYAHYEQRLFVGDTIYPYTAIHLDSLGSSVTDYMSSLEKLMKFISDVEKSPAIAATDIISKPNTGEGGGAVLPDSVNNKTLEFKAAGTKNTEEHTKQLVGEFLMVLGLDQTSLKFSVEHLLELCDWSVDNAVDMYFTSPGNVELLAPLPPKQEHQQEAVAVQTGEIVLSCGHVDANLAKSNVEQMLVFLNIILAGGISPAFCEGEYGEYTYENLTVLLPMKQVKKME